MTDLWTLLVSGIWSCQGTWLHFLNEIKNDFKIDFYFTLISDSQAPFSTIFQVKFHYMISQFHNLDITAKIDFNSICLIAAVLRSNELNASHVRSTHIHTCKHTSPDTHSVTEAQSRKWPGNNCACRWLPNWNCFYLFHMRN